MPASKRIDRAAAQLVRSAGRPEALWWEHLTEYERDGWRRIVAEVIEAYEGPQDGR